MKKPEPKWRKHATPAELREVAQIDKELTKLRKAASDLSRQRYRIQNTANLRARPKKKGT